MQPPAEATTLQSVVQPYIASWLDNFSDRIWDYLTLIVVAVVTAIAVLVYRIVKGKGNKWTYAGAGAAATLVVVLVSMLLIAVVRDKRVALMLAIGSFMLVPGSLYALSKLTKPEPGPALVTRETILAHYYMRVEKLYAVAKSEDLSDAEYRAVFAQIEKLRDELTSTKAGSVFSTATALAMAAPVIYTTDQRGRALQNAEELKERLLQKWNAWGGHAEPKL